jgi:hypothetical protein
LSARTAEGQHGAGRLKWQINGGYVALDGDTGALSCPFGLLRTGYILSSMERHRDDGRKVILVTDFNQSLTGRRCA